MKFKIYEKTQNSCHISDYKKQAFMEFHFHEFLFEIEPDGPPSSVCFCTIRGRGENRMMIMS